MKNSNNTINLLSIVYIHDFDVNLQLNICTIIEETMKSYGASAKLQDYSYNDEFGEGCLTFTLSRRLERPEREELRSTWEDEFTQIQFHTQKKLF